VIGNRIKAKVVKNKVAPPFKVSEFDILYNQGISYEGDLLMTALKYEVITRSGSTYYFNSQKLGVGYEASVNFLKEHSDISKENF